MRVEVRRNGSAQLFFRAAENRELCRRCGHWTGAGTGGAEYHGDRAVLALRRGNRDRMGECAALACDLGKTPAERRFRRRDVEAHDDVAGGERRRIRIMDE